MSHPAQKQHLCGCDPLILETSGDILVSYHVLQTFLKVAQERFGFVSLDLTVLYRFPAQVIVHLHCEYSS